MYGDALIKAIGIFVSLGLFVFLTFGGLFALKKGFTSNPFNKAKTITGFVHTSYAYFRIFFGLFFLIRLIAFFFIDTSGHSSLRNDDLTLNEAKKIAVSYLKKHKLNEFGFKATDSIFTNNFIYTSDIEIKDIEKGTRLVSKLTYKPLSTVPYYHTKGFFISRYSFVFLEKNHNSIYDGIVISVGRYLNTNVNLIQRFSSKQARSSSSPKKALSKDIKNLLKHNSYRVSFKIDKNDSISIYKFDYDDEFAKNIVLSVLKDYKYSAPTDIYGNKFSSISSDFLKLK